MSWWTGGALGDAITAQEMVGHVLKIKTSGMMDEWYSTGGQANWFFGAVATAVEKTTGSFRLTNGAYNGSAFSPKYYASAWRGGSRAKITTYNIGKVGGVLGKVSFWGGVIMDARGTYNYYYNPTSNNKVHPAKAGLNTAVGAFGTWVNPAVGIIYFGVDAFYPGGWEGYGNDYQSIQSQNAAIVPGFITAPYGSQKF
ncbi:hypothetical protein M9991_11020 [Chryseobacterium gallinarum]|uniref:hypothetical protein n=1 Tax=Chryseobacterium gallinarum TaxID=1324352 RepID=UPI0020259BFD|nr:hypothetical protein [Chryseobacterium gallinarum]MCL8537391.1 hypothetical protein [Chryseobacterium gallinarum]